MTTKIRHSGLNLNILFKTIPSRDANSCTDNNKAGKDLWITI